MKSPEGTVFPFDHPKSFWYVDFNNDGYSDIILGGGNPGRVQVIFGRSTRFETVTHIGDLPKSEYFTIYGDRDHDDETGEVVSGLGDVNGDGFADFMIGVPKYRRSESSQPEGGAFVFFGRETIRNKIHYENFKPGTDGIEIVADDDEFHSFGYRVRNAGDFNSDGYADFFVSAPYSKDANLAWIFYGSASLPPVLRMTKFDEKNGVELIGTPGSHTGASLSWNRDVDEDGYSDIFLGEVDYNDGEGRVGITHSQLQQTKQAHWVPSRSSIHEGQRRGPFRIIYQPLRLQRRHTSRPHSIEQSTGLRLPERAWLQ